MTFPVMCSKTDSWFILRGQLTLRMCGTPLILSFSAKVDNTLEEIIF